jgi:integration host factor subunit beta
VTKSELIEEVARQMPRISKRDVEIVVDTIFLSMTNALIRHDRIEIRGFGSFIAKPRRAREGRNPRTGAKVNVPQKWVPFFTCGKELKERVNKPASTNGAARGTDAAPSDPRNPSPRPRSA